VSVKQTYNTPDSHLTAFIPCWPMTGSCSLYCHEFGGLLRCYSTAQCGGHWQYVWGVE